MGNPQPSDLVTSTWWSVKPSNPFLWCLRFTFLLATKPTTRIGFVPTQATLLIYRVNHVWLVGGIHPGFCDIFGHTAARFWPGLALCDRLRGCGRAYVALAARGKSHEPIPMVLHVTWNNTYHMAVYLPFKNHSSPNSEQNQLFGIIDRHLEDHPTDRNW